MMTLNPVPKGEIVYDASDALGLTRQARRALECAALVIDSDTLLALAAQDLQEIKALAREVEDRRTAITGPLNQAVRAINDLFRSPKEYLEQAERLLKGAILQYTITREQQAAQAQRVAEDQAKCERARLSAHEREYAQQADQAQADAEAAYQEAQAAVAAGDPASARLADERRAAHLARMQQARSQADAASQTAAVITFTPPDLGAPRLAGISGRVHYTAQVVDLAALVRAVAAGQAPLESVQANDRFLGAQARALKRSGPLYPGVQANATRQLAASRAG